MSPSNPLGVRVDGPLAGAAYVGPTPGSSGGVERLLHDRVATLHSVLAHLRDDLHTRVYLSRAVLEALDTEARALRSDLLVHETNGNAVVAVPTSHSATLDARLDALAREHRSERVAAWRDLAALHREWRSVWRETRDLEQRVGLVMSGPRRDSMSGGLQG